MEFDFYYGSQADQFSFIKIPRAMITGEVFAELSLQAKMLYAILLDRMTLSRKNGWFDEEKRVYIIYPITEIQTDLGFSKKKAMDYLVELEQFGLILKKKRGFGLPSIIYVKSFLVKQESNRGVETGTYEIYRSTDFSISESMKHTTGGSEIVITEVPEFSEESKSASLEVSESALPEVPKSALPEVPKSIPLKSKTNKNKTNRSNTESYLIVSTEEDEMRYDANPDAQIKAYEELIKTNIDYESLLQANPYDRELIQGILQLMLETVLSQSENILIASEWYPAELVKSKFLKMEYPHIMYVLNCLKSNTTKVKNIKKYLLAALFNAPSTMDGYYRAEVNHDMPQFAR